MAAGSPDPGRGNTLATTLAAATATLAMAVVAWMVIVVPPPPTPTQIAEAVSERLAKDGYLKSQAFDQRMDALDEAVSALLKTEDFQRAVGDLERILQSCCRGTPLVGSQPRIWVVFENAKLNDDPTGTQPTTERLTADSRGIAISKEQRARLNLLAAALRACATPERRVRLKVQGYSSTREFLDAQGDPILDSKALNVKAANLRANAVIGHLREPDEQDNGIDVQHTAWDEYPDIRRPFLDSGEEFHGTDQELLNRAVYVEVLDAGGCAVDGAGSGDAR